MNRGFTWRGRFAGLLLFVLLLFCSAARACVGLTRYGVVVPLHEPWAKRRFVIATRDEEWLSAASRALAQHLRDVAREGAPPGPA